MSSEERRKEWQNNSSGVFFTAQCIYPNDYLQLFMNVYSKKRYNHAIVNISIF